jgi:hypothetical protein
MNVRVWGTLVTAALSLSSARAAEIDRCLPDGAELVLSVNVRQLLDAPVVVKHFLPEIKAAWERDGFKPRLIADLLKFDPLKDVTSITVAGPVKQAGDKALLIVRGRFDVEAIQTAAEIYANRGADDFKAHKQNEQRYYEFKEPRTRRTGFAALLDKETFVMSPSRDALLAAAERYRGRKAPQLAKELETLLGKVDGKQTLWLAGIASDDFKKDLASSPQVRKTADAVQSIHGGIAVAEGIQGDFLIQTNDARAAGEMRKLLEGIKSLVGLAVMDPESDMPGQSSFPRLGTLPTALVSAVKLATEKEAVTIKLTVTAEQLEKSLKDKPK